MGTLLEDFPIIDAKIYVSRYVLKYLEEYPLIDRDKGMWVPCGNDSSSFRVITTPQTEQKKA